jgi:uncharacterized membrane protein YccC
MQSDLRRPLSRRIRNRLDAADPGGFAARTALRASLALAVAVLLLLAFGAPLGDPVLLAIVGGEIAMMTSSSVSDASQREQRVSLLLAVLAAAAAVGLAVVVSPVRWLAVVVLCALVFVVVLVRSIGPRGMSVGLLAFMGYFMALYVGAKPAQLPSLLAAILVGGAVAWVVHFYVVRERRDRVRQAVLRAFRARVLLLLDALARDAADGGGDARRWQRIRRGTGRVGEVALALEQAVGVAEGTPPTGPVRAWVSSLLHAEVGVDMLVYSVHALTELETSPESRQRIAHMVRLLQSWIADGDASARDEAIRIHAEGSAKHSDTERAEHPELWWRLSSAMTTLAASRPWDAFPPLEAVPSGVTVGSFRPGGGGAAGMSDRSPNLRLAVQATVAVALSVVAGRAISGERWYWAVLAAFVVFIRATTVGETFSRAWQRVLGTVLGVAVGLGVSIAVGHRPWPAGAVGLVAIFLAYYLMRISYSGMIACFTVALALLYEEMGRAPTSLMALRLLETLAGAVIGVVVSAVVLPAHSERRVRTLAAGVVRAATEALERATTQDVVAEQDAVLHEEIRDVDRALAELRNALRPFWGPNIPVEPRTVTRQGRISAALAMATRRLATVPLSDDGERGALLRSIGERMTANTRVVADALEQDRPAEFQPVDTLIARLAEIDRANGDGHANQAVALLTDVDAIVRELARGTART